MAVQVHCGLFGGDLDLAGLRQRGQFGQRRHAGGAVEVVEGLFELGDVSVNGEISWPMMQSAGQVRHSESPRQSATRGRQFISPSS